MSMTKSTLIRSQRVIFWDLNATVRRLYCDCLLNKDLYIYGILLDFTGSLLSQPRREGLQGCSEELPLHAHDSGAPRTIRPLQNKEDDKAQTKV